MEGLIFGILRYLIDRTQQNWEDIQKNRNEAVWQRRIAIRQNWKKQTDYLRENPRNFSRLLNRSLDLGKG